MTPILEELRNKCKTHTEKIIKHMLKMSKNEPLGHRNEEFLNHPCDCSVNLKLFQIKCCIKETTIKHRGNASEGSRNGCEGIHRWAPLNIRKRNISIPPTGYP